MVIVAIQNPTFQKAMRVVTAITQDSQALVTTSFAHNYVTGQLVRFSMPRYFGMQQINQQQGFITVTSSTEFTVDLNTSSYDAFAVATRGGTQTQYAQVIPVGEETGTLLASTKNVLPYP